MNYYAYWIRIHLVSWLKSDLINCIQVKFPQQFFMVPIFSVLNSYIALVFGAKQLMHSVPKIVVLHWCVKGMLIKHIVIFRDRRCYKTIKAINYHYSQIHLLSSLANNIFTAPELLGPKVIFWRMVCYSEQSVNIKPRYSKMLQWEYFHWC